MAVTRNVRPLVEVVGDLAATARSIYAKSSKMPFDASEIAEQLIRATNPAESFMAHFYALDGLAHALIKAQMYREAAKITGCTLELMAGIRAVPLDGPEPLIVQCYLLAKHSHASGYCGDFLASINSDQELGRNLMAVLRSDADIPAAASGMKGLVDHLVSNTCAPKIPRLLTHSPSEAV